MDGTRSVKPNLPDEARWLKELEWGNSEMRKMLAEPLLKKRILEAVCEKNHKPGPSARTDLLAVLFVSFTLKAQNTLYFA